MSTIWLFQGKQIKICGHPATCWHPLMCIRAVMREYFVTYEPDLMRQQKVNHLQCRRFWAAGVNDIWAIDQHDKWLRFDLALHTGIEPFSGHILWMKVWHSNRNPQLILSYYIEAVEALQRTCATYIYLFWLMLLHCQTSLWSLKVILEQKTLALPMRKHYCGKCMI